VKSIIEAGIFFYVRIYLQHEAAFAKNWLF